MGKKKNGCLKVFAIIFISVFALIGCVAFMALNLSKPNKTESISSTPDAFSTMSELTPTTKEEIKDVLLSCGIVPIKIEHEDLLDGDDLFGYRMQTDEVRNVILYLDKDNLVSTIRYADRAIYENGAVVAQLSEYYLTRSEQRSIRQSCIKTITSILKSPSSAKFPSQDEWAMMKADGKITVRSYVDADNAFGASIRSSFQLVIEDNAITSLIFDGQEMIV